MRKISQIQFEEIKEIINDNPNKYNKCDKLKSYLIKNIWFDQFVPISEREIIRYDMLDFLMHNTEDEIYDKIVRKN